MRGRPLDLAATETKRTQRNSARPRTATARRDNPVPAPAKSAVGAKIYVVNKLGDGVRGNAKLPKRPLHVSRAVAWRPAKPLLHAEGAVRAVPTARPHRSDSFAALTLVGANDALATPLMNKPHGCESVLLPARKPATYAFASPFRRAHKQKQ